LKYLLVQPCADGPHRFEYATVVSTHQQRTGPSRPSCAMPSGWRCRGFGPTRSNCSSWTRNDGRFGEEIRLGVRLVETASVDATASLKRNPVHAVAPAV